MFVMASNFNLEIATPERNFYNDDIEMVVVRTPQGEMGVLPGHEPMVVAIDIGPVRIKKDGQWVEAVLTSGFMEATPERVVILCDTAEWPDEIDVNRAKSAKERAEERLNHKQTKLDYIKSQAALSRAMARLQVKNRKM
jgi:F-type H+-transporting ATPase subunit epsilon